LRRTTEPPEKIALGADFQTENAEL